MLKYAVMDNIENPRWQGHEEVHLGVLHALRSTFEAVLLY